MTPDQLTLTREKEREMTRKPTIYEALIKKLGRIPSQAELYADYRRILEEALRQNQTLAIHGARKLSTPKPHPP